MYSKQEASAIKEKFWTKFGQYMSPIPSHNGEKVHWINYKTGVKGIRFKMDADASNASIQIVIQGKSEEQIASIYVCFQTLSDELEKCLGEKWIWQAPTLKEGYLVASIFTNVAGMNIFDEKQWPAIISFLKPRMLGLDQFWQANKDVFEMLP